MSTITCTTSSTHQSSNNTRSMIFSVPANETINATVTVTNEAGVTTSKSTSAGLLSSYAVHCEYANKYLFCCTLDALAQTCQSEL